MAKFIGKIVPEKAPSKPFRPPRSTWFGLLVLPALLAGGLLTLQKQQISTDTGPRTTGGALGTVLALAETPSPRILADGGPAPDTTSKIVNPCELLVKYNGTETNQVSEAFHRKMTYYADGSVASISYSKDIVLFPIIPDGIRGIDLDGINVTTGTYANGMKLKDGVKTPPSNSWCSQGFWTRDVVYWFIYKGLAFLNWAAVAVGIILVLYGSLLYMTGFASEENVKKAKGIIIGTFVGLAIVLLAKVIVYGAVNAISGKNPTEVGAPVDVQ